MALVVVMVTVILVSLAAYGFNHQMTDAYRASRVQTDRAQARLAASSGIEVAAALLERPRATRIADAGGESFPFLQPLGGSSVGGAAVGGGTPSAPGEAPAWSFAIVSPASVGVGVGGQGGLSGSASFSGPASSSVSLAAGAAAPWRLGWVNESAKIHVGTLREQERRFPGHARRALSNLPGASPDQVDSFLRSVGIVSAGGSTAGSSGGLGGPGVTLRSPLADVAERRFTLLWFGGDWDHNYRIDPLERSLWGRVSGQSETAGTGPPPAWRDYLSFDSGERNVNRNGRPRILLNSGDLPALHRQLLQIWPQSWADFVILARQYGLSSAAGSDATSAALDLSRPASFRLETPFDLVDASVRIESQGETPVVVPSPFRSANDPTGNYLDSLADDVTVDANPITIGRIDLRTAPREVLLGVPGMSEEQADRILQARGSSAPLATARSTAAWLVREQVVDLATFRRWYPWVTVGGDCFSLQVIGFRDADSPIYRCTAVLDGRSSPVVVRDFRHWQDWGRGFDIRQLTRDNAQSGNMD